MEGQWIVLILIPVAGAVGAFIPKISEWISGRKKDQQADTAFVISNYKELVASQSDKMAKMETKLLDMQQKLIDMQTAHVQTLIENVTMKGQIQALTSENVSLRAKVEDLERRVQK